MVDAATSGRLAIISGSGRLPRLLADVVAADGRKPLMIALQGFFDSDPGPHEVVTIYGGQFGKLFSILRAHGCRDVVMVGEVKRPRLRDLRLDWGGIRRLALVFRARHSGDDAAMRLLTDTFEGAGLRVVSLRDVAPGLAAPLGVIGRHEPSRKASEVIARGFSLLKAMSPFDVGQAAVVHGRRVLAVEGAEGTNAMIARIGDLRRNSRFPVKSPSGILVKMPKASQELRNDMPVIGSLTIEAARDAGLEGVAVAAGGVALADCAELARLADEAGIFLVGCDPSGNWVPA